MHRSLEHDILRFEVIETAPAKAMEALQPRGDIVKGPEQTLRDELARIDV